MSPVGRQFSRGDVGIDRDPVASNGEAAGFRRGVDLERGGPRHGHVAINTPAHHAITDLRRLWMRRDLMALEAVLSKGPDVALSLVHVVAGRARHVGAWGKTHAPTQKTQPRARARPDHTHPTHT